MHARAREIDTESDSCIKAYEQMEVKIYKEDHAEEALDDHTECAAAADIVLNQ